MTKTTGRFSNIVHPTDLGEAGRAAFAHGLRLAVAARGRFAVVHNAGRELDDAAALEAFPGVRDTLASWGLLDLGAHLERRGGARGIRVSKADLGGGGTVETSSRPASTRGCRPRGAGHPCEDGPPRWPQGLGGRGDRAACRRADALPAP
ncbi:MAG: hypothetical protein R3D25_16150 [Geminicoccaceae bacterium]